MILKIKQKIPISLSEAWNFFTDPQNLDKLTPADMDFVITSELESEAIYPGMIITYRVSPLWGFKMNWVTEISHVKDRAYFIDDQRSGPFAIWHHQHHFSEIEGGVEMTDIVTYSAPFGFVGRWVETLIVNARVRKIFEYRKKVLIEIFGDWKA